MKKLAFLLLVSLFSIALFSQNPSRISLRGTVQDTSGELIPLATVMLLSPKDSQLVNFTRGDEKGAFEFKNIKNSAYLLKISYVGYLPLQISVQPSATSPADLGPLNIKPISTELMEVVIKAARATLSIRGDTIEYDASSFKVPPGSSVEDLLRRLPGIEVDADGNLKAQGQDVKRVYVDGKTFFGDDPKAATKNLGAETLSKIQVYNEKSDQAKLTGIDDGKKEKAMNLELKEEYKKGRFGKLTGAAGDQERWAARGNYNRFNPKEQLSFIGYANNINQTGVNWEDYSEFKGQSTFSDNDNGDFGFSNGGGRRYYSFGDEDSETPLNNFDGRGFTENAGIGSNYNYDHKKAKFNASYFYNQSDLGLDQFTLRQTFLADSSFFSNDSLRQTDFRRNHNLNSRLEYEFDSTNTLILKGQTRFGFKGAEAVNRQLFYGENGAATNQLNLSNSNELDTWRLISSAIFRHRFKKKGRSFAVSGGWNDSKTDGPETIFSLNEFFQANDFTEQMQQLNARENRTQQGKLSLLFTESFAKNWFLESFYNFSKTKNEVNRQVADLENGGLRRDDLSLFYEFGVLYNRLGSSVRYSHAGLNAAAGLAWQKLDLDGQYSLDKNAPLLAAPTVRSFKNWTPNASISYEITNNSSLDISYSRGVSEPRLNDLQPIPNISNPAYRTEGNPNLEPEVEHEFEIGARRWNPSNFSSMNGSVSWTKYDSRIVYNQTTEFIDSIGFRTTSRPVNLSGGGAFNVWSWLSFPIVKTKLTLSMSGNIWSSTTPAFVNGVENETQNTNYNLRPGLNFTPNKTLIVGLNANVRFTKISYSIQTAQNQQIQNHGLSGSVKWQFLGKNFLESNLDYSIYKNDRFGFDQKIPVWNASVRRLFGKNNRLEARLAAFDLLNKKRYIRQYGSQNFVTRSEAATLARYFMLSVSYNLKGYEAKLKKNDWW